MSESQYADAVLSWLGKIPPGWQERRLKTLLEEPLTDGPHETPEFLSDGIPFLSVDGIQEGELIFEGCRYVSQAAHNEYKKKCAPRYGDILIGKAASTGKIARVKVDFPFSVWSPLALIRSRATEIRAEFLEYALKSAATQAQIDTLCTVNTQKNISMDEIPLLRLCVPPLSEQDAIVAFLNTKIGKIDQLVALRRQQMEFLREQRDALVWEAVTRGLNPSVPLKESGSLWLGQIPSHWKVLRNKVIFKEIDSRSSDGSEELLSVSHISGVTPRAEKEDVNMFLAESNEGYKRVEVGDLAINTMWAWMGALGFSRYRGIVSPAYNVYRFRGAASTAYYDLLFRSAPFTTEIIRHSTGIWESRLRLYPHAFFEICSPVFSLAEQEAIVDYVDKMTGQTENVLSTYTRELELLAEYRAALIHECVTGQRRELGCSDERDKDRIDGGHRREGESAARRITAETNVCQNQTTG